MTNSLALARAAIPSSKWIYDHGMECVRRVCDDGGMGESFDPRNNPAQFVEVLAWLTLAVNCQKYNQGFLEIRPLAVVFGATISGDQSRITVIEHDGTAPSLVAAVVTAAERVAQESAK